MDDLERIIKEILSRYDLSKPEGRDAAYEECIEFAETRLTDDLGCNAFLRSAAQMLEKEPVEFDIIRDQVEIPEDAKIDIAYDERQGFMLTANSSGLEYFADLLHLLSESPIDEHVHLFNDEEPLTPISFNIVMYHESDDWFRKAELEAAETSDQAPVRKRNIEPEQIYAVQIVGNVPEGIPVVRDRIYLVERVSDLIPEYDDDVGEDEKIWKKGHSGDRSRYICLEVSDDWACDLKLVLHLDDSDVIFFKREDLEHLF